MYSVELTPTMAISMEATEILQSMFSTQELLAVDDETYTWLYMEALKLL